MKNTYENEPLAIRIEKREIILDQLRKKGFRITEQRRLLIDIILEDECSSCKEIYYKAIKKDASVGIATIYRMVKTLEDLGVINRKNIYLIDYDNLDMDYEKQVLFVDEKTEEVVEVKKGEWFKILKKALMEQGFTDVDNISILIKQKDKDKNEEVKCDDKLYHTCRCNNTSCKHHCGKRNAS